MFPGGPNWKKIIMDKFPSRSNLTIHFSHVAYRLSERFALRETGINHFQTWNADDTAARIGEGHVAVLSGLWNDGLLEAANRLQFIQVPAAGYDQFSLQALKSRGVRLANGAGVNKNAVSEHALGLILSFTRLLHTGRDRQRECYWRAMISDLGAREDELGGKTLLIYGLGSIGSRLAKLARVLDMHVIGIKRDTTIHDGSCHEVRDAGTFLRSLPQADFVVLTCPLTSQTANIVNAEALASMSPNAYLINVARGGCVDQQALVAALEKKQLAGAGIDTTVEEPLASNSPLWGLENVIITPHTAGETRRYEDNVIDILLKNLDRLWTGKSSLVNEVI